MGRSPGLVVTGGDSCSYGCEFESQHHILNGHFSRKCVVKIVMFVWKRQKINVKEAGDGPFKKLGFKMDKVIFAIYQLQCKQTTSIDKTDLHATCFIPNTVSR